MTSNKYNPDIKDPHMVRMFSNPERVPFAFGSNTYKGMRSQAKSAGRSMKKVLKSYLGRRATPDELKTADRVFRARAEALTGVKPANLTEAAVAEASKGPEGGDPR